MSGPRSSLAPLFAALGDKTRLKLVARLSGGTRMSIAQLTSGSDVTRQAITKHLHVLADAGLVHGTRRGRRRVFEIELRRLRQARRYLELISRQWDAALARLKRTIED
ncbi:MAG: ArsR/SmtB family transcription factor [Thermoanaerobaculia bacterium]